SDRSSSISPPSSDRVISSSRSNASSSVCRSAIGGIIVEVVSLILPGGNRGGRCFGRRVDDAGHGAVANPKLEIETGRKLIPRPQDPPRAEWNGVSAVER